MKIESAVALITGANGGIGTEFVEALRTAGAARIYACARHLDAVQELEFKAQPLARRTRNLDLFTRSIEFRGAIAEWLASD